jgi:hypothetical protein
MFVLDGLAVYLQGAVPPVPVCSYWCWRPGGSTGLAIGVSTEYFVLTLFALAGMLLAASANNFAVMYVALELITVTFYVLTSYQRSRDRLPGGRA